MAERTRHIFLGREDFDKLRSGEEEESLEVGLKSWCIVKLDGVRPAGTCSLWRARGFMSMLVHVPR